MLTGGLGESLQLATALPGWGIGRSGTPQGVRQASLYMLVAQRHVASLRFTGSPLHSSCSARPGLQSGCHATVCDCDTT